MNKTLKYVKPVLRNLQQTNQQFITLLAAVQKKKFGFIQTDTEQDNDSMAIAIEPTLVPEKIQELIDYLSLNDLLYGQVKEKDSRIINFKVPIEGFDKVKKCFLNSEYSKMYEEVDVTLKDNEDEVMNVLTKSEKGIDQFYNNLLKNRLITDKFDKEDLRDGRELDFPIEKEEEFFI